MLRSNEGIPDSHRLHDIKYNRSRILIDLAVNMASSRDGRAKNNLY